MAKRPAPAQPQGRSGDETQFALHEVSLLKAIPAETVALIERLCGVGRNPYRDGGEEGRRSTDYNCGRLSIAHMLKQLREAQMPGNSRGAPPELPNSPTPSAEKS